ncbi:MAG: histidine kinase dimerization/phospho-acceptor domain-containing protein [Planctomycetota bacterium]
MLTQVAEPATRASVGVLGRDELARSLAQVPAAPGFALTLALDHAGNGDAIQAVAALDHDLQRLLVSGHAPSSYLDELLLPWRIAILGGVGVALAAIASAWFAARLVRRELELARLRGELVTSISHELRTPLTSILVNAELLEDPRIDDPARHRYAGRIHERAPAALPGRARARLRALAPRRRARTPGAARPGRARGRRHGRDGRAAARPRRGVRRAGGSAARAR